MSVIKKRRVAMGAPRHVGGEVTGRHIGPSNRTPSAMGQAIDRYTQGEPEPALDRTTIPQTKPIDWFSVLGLTFVFIVCGLIAMGVLP